MQRISRRLAAGSLAALAVAPVAPADPAGTILWRAPIDTNALIHRPAVGPDGSIYLHTGGDLTAFDPADGGVLWTRDVGGGGPVSVDAAGNLYGAGGTRTFSYTADGDFRWAFEDPNDGTQGVIAGPTVGPDGRVYQINEFPGLGAFALTAGGDLAWSPGDPAYGEHGQLGQPIVFSGGNLFAAFDHGAVRLGGLDAVSLDGDYQWGITIGVANLNVQVGPDGTVYVSQVNWVHARRPDGSAVFEHFTHFEPSAVAVTAQNDVLYTRQGALLRKIDPADGSTVFEFFYDGFFDSFGPDAHPTEPMILLNARTNNFGPSAFKGLSSVDGSVLWSAELPLEQHPTFGQTPVSGSTYWAFSPDGTVGYVGAVGSGTHYLYAVQTLDAPGTAPADLNGDGAIDASDLGALISAWGQRGVEADLDGDGVVGASDLGILLAAWG